MFMRLQHGRAATCRFAGFRARATLGSGKASTVHGAGGTAAAVPEPPCVSTSNLRNASLTFAAAIYRFATLFCAREAATLRSSAVVSSPTVRPANGLAVIKAL
jgi:hypothetical protein